MCRWRYGSESGGRVKYVVGVEVGGEGGGRRGGREGGEVGAGGEEERGERGWAGGVG